MGEGIDEDRDQGTGEHAAVRDEFEVTDLRGTRSGTATGPLPARDAPPVAGLTGRQRARRTLAGLGTVALALVVVLASVPSVREGVARRLFGPASATNGSLEPGGDLFYILPGVSWASVSLDGQPLSYLPMIGSDAPMRLARGHHVLVWRADPFQSWQCTISVPVTGGDTCPYDRGYVGKPGVNEFWVLPLFPSLALLPAGRWTALLDAAQSVLDGEQSSDVVQTGEVYLSEPVPGPNLGRTASQPLEATLSFHLLTETPTVRPAAPTCGGAPAFIFSCSFMGQSCLLLCTVPEVGSPSYWSVLAPIYGTWDYTTLDGQSVARDQPDGGSGILAPLRIDWDGAAWHVALALTTPLVAYTSVSSISSTDRPVIGQPACAALEVSTQLGQYPLTRPQVPGYSDLSWRFAAAPILAFGCLAVATPRQAASGTPATALAPASVLERFGIMLAANETAHQVWPQLPVADGYEQALIRQMVPLPGS